MMVSETRITETGIEQSWFTRRKVAWDDIQFAKFIPLVASKRLVCFTATGHPVVFQAGPRELQIAFARIAVVYRRRPPGQSRRQRSAHRQGVDRKSVVKGKEGAQRR